MSCSVRVRVQDISQNGCWKLNPPNFPTASIPARDRLGMDIVNNGLEHPVLYSYSVISIYSYQPKS